MHRVSNYPLIMNGAEGAYRTVKSCSLSAAPLYDIVHTDLGACHYVAVSTRASDRDVAAVAIAVILRHVSVVICEAAVRAACAALSPRARTRLRCCADRNTATTAIVLW
jgi:hypothetical protein